MSFVPADAICSQKASILQSTLEYLYFPSSWHCDHSLPADTWNTWERQSRRIAWQTHFTPTKLILTDVILHPTEFRASPCNWKRQKNSPILVIQWPWITWSCSCGIWNSFLKWMWDEVMPFKWGCALKRFMQNSDSLAPVPTLQLQLTGSMEFLNFHFWFLHFWISRAPVPYG